LQNHVKNKSFGHPCEIRDYVYVKLLIVIDLPFETPPLQAPMPLINQINRAKQSGNPLRKGNMADSKNSFGARSSLVTDEGSAIYFNLGELENAGLADLNRLPFIIKILLENLVRNEDGALVTAEDVENMARWDANASGDHELPFMPSRVLLQDFTGIPSLVDLAAMREVADRMYGNPVKINPVIPSELVIDHSVQVDHFGTKAAFEKNVNREFQRNSERYAFLRWGQKNFKNFHVVPPATGICHQVNLEYLARVVFTKEVHGQVTAFPDTLVGLDSHTTMINGIGVLGWGVGGIEAEAVMLGKPYYLITPQVVGFRLEGRLPDKATATDLVLTITELLRKKGVVGKFVEFYGPGVGTLSCEDRATIANMAPEYGATTGFFPVDERTLEYLRLTGRPESFISLVETYCKAQGLFRTDEAPDPVYSDTAEFDMGAIESSLAGPSRPQQRISVFRRKQAFLDSTKDDIDPKPAPEPTPEPLMDRDCRDKRGVDVTINGETFRLCDGHVVIAAITSCTNTSNPSVMIGAGLLAKKATRRGLTVKPWVKTSLAPGSKVVLGYLEAGGLLDHLTDLRFHHVAYGCTTCIGNSGPLPGPVATAITDHNLSVAAVLSGNRNFEGRINPLTKENFLASPLLVIAYAIAGRMDIDFETEPLGSDPDGKPVYLNEIWPSSSEIEKVVKRVVTPEMYRKEYATVFEGSGPWESLPIPEGALFNWEPESTYIKEPPFFAGITGSLPDLRDIRGARILVLLGDTVTTDHISPAGAIPADSPAGAYLISLGIEPPDFNSFGSRRGNHEVMLRGTFGNIRLKNKLVPGVDGGWTVFLPEGKKMSIYDAAMGYQKEETPLLVMAGREYGAGSSRDWAAKGTALLGVQAVLTESYERIHRSNLVCMGVLPLQFRPGENRDTLQLDGTEAYDITGIEKELGPRKELTVTAHRKGGQKIEFRVIARIDSPVELSYYRHGGILAYVLRNLG